MTTSSSSIFYHSYDHSLTAAGIKVTLTNMFQANILKKKKSYPAVNFPPYNWVFVDMADRASLLLMN